MRKFLKKTAVRVVVFGTGIVVSMIIWGCSTSIIIPTVTNPALERVAGVNAPYVKMFGIKVTLQGFNDGIETLADFEHDITYPAGKEWEKRGRKRSKNVATTILGLLSAAGLAGTGALPMALKVVPKGFVKKED